MKTTAILACICIALGIADFTSTALAQGFPPGIVTIPKMVSPEIDKPGEPFSYFSRPTDQIGVMLSPTATEVTPEGYLYTGYGELMFFVGLDRVAVNQRIRTLEDGYIPVLSYEVAHDGLTYRFTFFAASLGAQQDGAHVVNFARVTVRNPGKTARRGYVTTAWRYQGEQTTLGDGGSQVYMGDDRFLRPKTHERVGEYQQPGAEFKPNSVYEVRDHAFLRDGQAIYFFPAVPEPQITPSFRDYHNDFKAISASKADGVTTPLSGAEKSTMVEPTTPMATAEYALMVPAGGERHLDFKMPLQPIAPESAEFSAVAKADFEDRHEQVKAFWRATVERGMQITTPEEKVNATFKTCLVNDLLSLNKIGDDYVQTVNQLHYHSFYLRDSSDFVRMYDSTDYPDIAGRVVDFFATRQQPDGNFLSQAGQYDGWGQALWTYGEHYRITHDKSFAAEVYPRVQRAADWLQKATAADPLHLMPSTFVRDNEYIPGHLTGYNFLALDGLQAAVILAHDLGHAEDEQRFRNLETELRRNFFAQLDKVTAQTGGYIPPALDGDMGGSDWGNLLAVTPEPQLPAQDERVTATLRRTQERYEEGLITYRQPDQGTFLHHYLTIKNTLTELVRGEQEQAVREFYAELMHTSSTNAGFEYTIRPWGDRDPMGNLPPHGWFAAEFRNVLRNMMVREEGSTLHLLSAVTPEWIGAGKEIKVERAKTYFGLAGFDWKSSESGAVLVIDPQYDAGHAPEKIVVHLPWFVDVTSAIVDGKAVAAHENRIELPPNARKVELQWKRKAIASDLPVSYADAVERYKREYRERWDKLNSENE